jgi:succinoglycan biosynthesis protein ExoM
MQPATASNNPGPAPCAHAGSSSASLAGGAAIDICVTTFRRPALLASLLDALLRQAGMGPRVRIVVVDNDAQHSARTVIEACRSDAADAGVQLVYAVEPRQNIALARNRALALCQADYIAFIDDDELPCTGWLQALLGCLQAHGADVAFGPVHARLPPHAPPWARDCYRKPQRASGTPLTHGGAGNVMFRRSALDGPGACFDPAYGLTGGEDTDWSYRLHLAGKRLVWCAEAQATEHVPDARLRLAWARRRAFRGGQTYYRVFVRRYTRLRTALWFAVKCTQLLAALLAAPLLLCVHRRSYIALTLRGAGAAGQVMRFLSAPDIEEYHGSRDR